MSKDTLEIGKVIEIDQAGLKNQLGEVVRSTVEETLNGLLDAEADRICGAQRYERSPDRKDINPRRCKINFQKWRTPRRSPPSAEQTAVFSTALQLTNLGLIITR